VDPMDRFLLRPLDDVLVAEGVLSREKADELLESAKGSGETFASVIIEAGFMTAWDLAKLVSTKYQLPVHPLTGYRFDRDLFEGIPASFMHRHQVLPVGRFGRTRTFAVVEPPDRAVIEELQSTCGSSLHFFVSEEPEVARVLRDTVKVVDTARDTTWQKLFDSAEQEIEREITIRKTKV
jgi:hypothetical protein